MLIIILESVGVPSAGVALILGVDRILDMIRTTVNVTGDAAVAVSVASSENQLKIYNNDVKCTHSSTTGDLDDDVIYYMATRGIKPNHAKQLMLKGFLDETLDKIEIDYFKLYILNKIEQHLNNAYTI